MHTCPPGMVSYSHTGDESARDHQVGSILDNLASGVPRPQRQFQILDLDPDDMKLCRTNL